MSLPYITATGNVERALNAIKAAATPESVSQDFVKTILKIKGGSGDQVTSYLKKIGFAASDGKPTEIYTRFRNSNRNISGSAVAEAIRKGYAQLYVRNEYMHQLSDEDLKGLIVEETGAGDESNVPNLILSCISALKKFAVFNAPEVIEAKVDERKENKSPTAVQVTKSSASQGVGLNLSYTINLNLPPTSDIAVFNAIFKSLKQNLLSDMDG